LTHARAFVDLKDGIASASAVINDEDDDDDDAHGIVESVVEDKPEIVEAPLTPPEDVSAEAIEASPEDAQHLLAPEEGEHADDVVGKTEDSGDEVEMVDEQTVDTDSDVKEKEEEAPVAMSVGTEEKKEVSTADVDSNEDAVESITMTAAVDATSS
jgi:hypothetical protein